MNIELAITGVTQDNRYCKLQKAARALSDRLGLGAAIEAPLLTKAKTHKYIDKKWVNDHWEYVYPQTNNERRANIANQTDLITGIQPLSVNSSNVVNVVNNYFMLIQQAIDKGVKCRWLQNRKVAGIIQGHFFKVHGDARDADVILSRAKLLPFVLPIIEKYGHISHVQKNNLGGYDYELVGRSEINGKRYAITVILSDTDKDKNLLYISVFGLQNKMIKSMFTAASPIRTGVHRFPFTQLEHGTLSMGHTLIIPQISAKSIEKLPDLEVFIKNVSPRNRKDKFAKAIRAVSRHLGVPVYIGNKAGGEHKGEAYMYPVQQELSDRWTGYYQGIISRIYETVIAALGLPRVEAETMRKAIGGDDPLRYVGFWPVGKLLQAGVLQGKGDLQPRNRGARKTERI